LCWVNPRDHQRPAEPRGVKFLAPPPGFDPGLRDSKSRGLPITPRGIVVAGTVCHEWCGRHAEGFRTYGSVGYGGVGKDALSEGRTVMTPPTATLPDAP